MFSQYLIYQNIYACIKHLTNINIIIIVIVIYTHDKNGWRMDLDIQ
jgi:hypothetical protein